MKGKTVKLYLCGSISKDPNYAHKFNDAEDALRKAGYEVLNPVSLNLSADESNWSFAMRKAIAMMMTADGVATFPDYINSKGAYIEVCLADSLKMVHADIDAWIIWSNK